jgi:hypothetical protein
MPLALPSFSSMLIQMGLIFSQTPVFSQQLVPLFPLVPPLALSPPSLPVSWPRTDYSFFERLLDCFFQPVFLPPPLFSSAMPARMD